MLEDFTGIWIQKTLNGDTVSTLTSHKCSEKSIKCVFKFARDGKRVEGKFDVHDDLITDSQDCTITGKYTDNGEIEIFTGTNEKSHVVTWKRPSIDDYTGEWMQVLPNESGFEKITCSKASNYELQARTLYEDKTQRFAIRGESIIEIIRIDHLKNYSNNIGHFNGDGNITWSKDSENYMTWMREGINLLDFSQVGNVCKIKL